MDAFLIKRIYKQSKTNHISLSLLDNEWYATIENEMYCVTGKGKKINTALIDLYKRIHITKMAEKNNFCKEEKDIVSWVFRLYNFLK